MKTAIVVVSSPERLNQFDVLNKSIQKYVSENVDVLLYYGGEESIGPKGWGIINFNHHVKNSIYKNDLYTYCSLRPKAVLDAFERGYDAVWLLGADTEFFASPRALYTVLEDNDMFVTMYTHESYGQEDDLYPNDYDTFMVGQINADLVGFRKSDQVIKFLKWLDKRVETKAVYRGRDFVDQVWMSMCFSFVDKVAVIRELGYNVGNYNMHNRYMNPSLSRGDPNKPTYWSMADCSPLVLFHYAGLEKGKEEFVSKHQNRYKADGFLLEFLKNYTSKL